MSERIRGSYDDALYKSTYAFLYFTDHYNGPVSAIGWLCVCTCVCADDNVLIK